VQQRLGRSPRAQQAAWMRRIGILLNASSDDPQYQAWVGAFLQELAQLGWVIGRNVRIDTGTRNFLGEVRSDRANRSQV
jgi:hypothetical protein